MRKKFTILLILTFILGLAPINFSEAITQDQISAEVQIVCPDNYGNWYSGSGTIIDPKGIILTNKHVVSDQYGGIIKTCFIGFTESINQEPNFGTETNPNLAEVKYYATTSDMDSAILYLNNPTNKSYTFVDIWNSNSNTLQFGHKIEAIGFPSIGGSTITYTSGDFSGFGSASDGTQNYIKATTPLEHGNSGGAAYNPTGQFIGIPTMVVAGTLNSLSYILSVNSIKNWLSGILGNNYQQEVIEQKPIIETPKVNIQDDITPPNINSLQGLDLFLYDDNKNFKTTGGGVDKNWFKSSKYANFKIIFPVYALYGNDLIKNLDVDSGVNSVYFNYSENLSQATKELGKELSIEKKTDNQPWTYSYYYNLTDIISLPKENSYYISLRFKDKNGNISDSYVITYIYESEKFKTIQNIKFYKDSGYKNIIGNYDYISNNSGDNYKYCVTKLKNVYLEWDYSSEYTNYIAKSFPADMDNLVASDKDSKNFELIGNNRYLAKNLNMPKENNKYYGINICENKEDNNCNITGKVTSFLLKPVVSENNLFLEGKNTIIKFAYDPNFKYDLLCGDPNYEKINNFKKPYYILKDGNLLNPDNSLLNRLKGKILLQVEAHGEAYYVYPKDGKRYYMANGNEAYRIMRYLGVGITNNDLDKIKNDKSFAKKHSGKIFLQVEAHGEAFYIDFDGNAHYLKDGGAAYAIMRDLGLGITNADLNKITEGKL